jgi:hypothetical protein
MSACKACCSAASSASCIVVTAGGDGGAGVGAEEDDACVPLAAAKALASASFFSWSFLKMEFPDPDFGGIVFMFREYFVKVYVCLLYLSKVAKRGKIIL